jgi:phenylacetic acid degradation operon negative regulatory protein
VTYPGTDVSENITSEVSPGRWPSRGRSVGLVAFLFGMAGRAELSGPVLRRMLADLGVSPDAARALLSRMCRHGQLSSERHGRITRYRLAGEFARSFERVRDQSMARPAPWTGRFHALLYQVPEEHRAFRDALRRSAVFAGYGLLQQGVLISPIDRSAALSGVLSNPPHGTHTWLTWLSMVDVDAARAASLAWALPTLAEVYRTHIDRLSQAMAAGGGTEVLRDYVDLLLPALTDTLREPPLPAELLPPQWPGTALRRVLAEFSAEFRPRSERYLRSIGLSMEYD